jgi:hypothetical protein
VETELKAREYVLPPTESTAVATLRLNYEKLTLRAQRGARVEEGLLPKEIRDLIDQGIKATQGYGWVNRIGEIYKTNTDLRATGPYAPIFKLFSDEALESLQAASIPMPGGRINPNHTWKSERNVRFQLLQIDEQLFGPPAGGRPGARTPPPQPRVREYRYKQEVTYKYIGSRLRNGTKEAVISVEGKIVTPPGVSAGSGARGAMKGFVYVDLETGVVLEADVEKEFEIDTSSQGIKKRYSGINRYKLSRGTSVAGT